MRKTFYGLCVSAALAAFPAWSQQYQLAHNAAPGNPKAVASDKFAELVDQKTDGRVKIAVGESAQFGDDVEAITSMRLGTLAFAANSQGSTSSVVPEFAVLGLPFLFQSLPQAWKVLDGPVGEQLAAASEKQGLVLLALWDNGIRQISDNVRPIEKPEDLEGIKLRTPPDPMTVDIFTALGANPTPMAFSELYIALQQGVVDGQENPLMNIYSSKLYEVQKYISMTGHKYEATPVFASKVVFDTFSPEDQQAIRDAAAEAGKLNREMSQQADEELRGKMEEAGVKFNAVDPAPFVEATKPVYDKWHDQFPDLVDLVKEEAAKAAGGLVMATAPLREAGPPASFPIRMVDSAVTYAATSISIAALVAMFAALFAEVVVRYLTKQSLGWPTELPNFMFPWLIMAGIVLAAQHGAHIAVTLTLGLIGRGAQRALLVAMHAVIALTFLYLTWVGLDVIKIAGGEVYPVTGISANWAYLALIAGFAGIGVTALTTVGRVATAADPMTVRTHHAEEEL